VSIILCLSSFVYQTVSVNNLSLVYLPFSVSKKTWFSMSCSSGTGRRTFAGEPTTIIRAETSFVTTLPAATRASSPTVIPGEESGIGAYSSSPFQGRSAEMLLPLLSAAEEVVIGKSGTGGDEAVVLYRGQSGDIGLGLDLALQPDSCLVFYGDAPTDDGKLPYGDILADRGKVAHEYSVSQDSTPVDDAVGADGDSPAKNEGGKDTGVSCGS
jgi:hypothetical protein